MAPRRVNVCKIETLCDSTGCRLTTKTMPHKKPMLLAIYLGMLSFLPNFAGAVVVPPTYISINGHQAFVLLPSTATADGANTSWVWYAPTIVGGTPYASNDWLFQKLLDKGIAVAGIDVGESYGSPAGRAVYSQFYTYATDQIKLASKPCLLAQSRGGLMAYNWAAENADKVNAIAGIYPVGDLRSYPGLATAAPAYGMTESQLAASLAVNNPIDRLAPLAQADVPIFHIHGDSDTIVSLAANSQVVYDRYTGMGGRMQLVVVPGKGHEEVPEFFQSTQLLDFIVSHANPIVTPEPGTGTLLGMAILMLAAYVGRKRVNNTIRFCLLED
jgi:hypothetical protein